MYSLLVVLPVHGTHTSFIVVVLVGIVSLFEVLADTWLNFLSVKRGVEREEGS